jgi:transposase
MNNHYNKAFKEEAVRLSDEIGPKKASEQLGIPYHTLQGWRKQKKLHGDNAYIGSGRAYASADKTAREIELEKEISELRRANEILKDALGFFAKDRKR